MPAADTRRRVDELIRRCYVGLDATAFRHEVLQRLRTIIDIDAAFFATVDPATMLFTSAVSEEPLVDAAILFLDNELDGRDVNRFIDVAADPVGVRSLDGATNRVREDSARYTTIMRPLGLGDELRAALRTGDTCWGVMCLHREDGTRGFAERDAAIVARLAPHLAEGLRRAMLLHGFGSVGELAGHGVVILDDDGYVVSMNDAAERLLAEITDADWPSSIEVPIPVLSAASAARSSVDLASSTLRVRTAAGRWLSIHGSRLHGSSNDQTVVVLEPAEPAQLTSLILGAHAVTGAQARVVALILRGYSTQQIVNELRISANTVQEHLTAVFDKLGVRSRRELAAALLHTSTAPPTTSNRPGSDAGGRGRA
jgi:DNA-binding CsgD family transcriptional regulator